MKISVCCLLGVVAYSAFPAMPLRIDVKSGDSLVAVRDRVRAMSAAEKANGVEIVLEDGEYYLSDGIAFTAKDGGVSAAAPVVWRAAKPGAARIVGAVRIPAKSFAKVEDPGLLARLPEEGHGKVYAADVSAFCPEEVPQLEDSFRGVSRPPLAFIDGRFGTFASYPNGGGWMSFDKCVDHGTPMPEKKYWYSGGAFVCEDPRCERWDFSKGVWLNGYFTHDWDNMSVKATSYGPENGTNGIVRLGKSGVLYGIMHGTWGRKERRFRAFNLFEELDEPGEWWFDRERKILYVVPNGGKMAEDADIRLAFSTKKILSGDGVANLRFEDIAVSYNYGSLAEFRKCEGVEFRNCTLSCAGAGGVEFAEGHRNAMVSCEVVRIGATGVTIKDGDRRTLSASGSRVERCRIHDYGILIRTYTCAIYMEGCGSIIRGNEMFDAPHMAMRFESNDCLIESNDIHHVLLETGDAGALYSGKDWTTQGNVLRYNFIHDLGVGTTDCKSGDVAVSGTNVMGCYFDDCDCGDEIYGNVFLNVPRGILLGGGRDHPVRDNVFINCKLGLSMDCRGLLWKGWNTNRGGWNLEDKARAFDYTNGVWAARYPRLANIMNDHPREPLYNPIEGNTFIDCDEVVSLAALDATVNEKAPGVLSRLASIRDNTVIYTKGANTVKRQKLDPRIATGFRVLDCAKE